MRARLLQLFLLALLTGGLIAPAAMASAAVGDNTWERSQSGDIVASDIVTNAPWEFEIRLESTSDAVVPPLVGGVYDALGRFCGQDFRYGGSSTSSIDFTFTWAQSMSYPWASPGTCRELTTWEPVPATYPVKLHIWNRDLGVNGSEPVPKINRPAEWIYVIAAAKPDNTAVLRTAAIEIRAESGLVGAVTSPLGAFTGRTRVFASGDGTAGLGKVCLTRKWTATVRNPQPGTVLVNWSDGSDRTLVDNTLQPRRAGEKRGEYVEVLTQNEPACTGAPNPAPPSGLQADWTQRMTATPLGGRLVSLSYEATVTVHDRQGGILGTLVVTKSTAQGKQALLGVGAVLASYPVTWWE